MTKYAGPARPPPLRPPSMMPRGRRASGTRQPTAGGGRPSPLAGAMGLPPGLSMLGGFGPAPQRVLPPGATVPMPGGSVPPQPGAAAPVMQHQGPQQPGLPGAPGGGFLESAMMPMLQPPPMAQAGGAGGLKGMGGIAGGAGIISDAAQGGQQGLQRRRPLDLAMFGGGR